MPDNVTNYDFYFNASQTIAPTMKSKKKKDKESFIDINVELEKYIKDYKNTKVKRKTFRYVPKPD